MPSRSILDFDDPGVRIKADFAHKTFLDLRFRRRLLAQAAAKSTIGRMCLVKRRLRRWAEQLRGAIKPVQLDENSPGFLRTAAPHGSEGAFDMAAANISSHPNRGFETHEPAYLHTQQRLEIPVLPIRISQARPASYSSGRPVMAASSRVTRSDTLPVIGSFRSRSNLSIAA
jgi:hypothetical protein